MPGMAANSKIFEFLKFPKNFKLHFLEWFNQRYENLNHMLIGCQKNQWKNIVLVGVLLGGIIVQDFPIWSSKNNYYI